MSHNHGQCHTQVFFAALLSFLLIAPSAVLRFNSRTHRVIALSKMAVCMLSGSIMPPQPD